MTPRPLQPHEAAALLFDAHLRIAQVVRVLTFLVLNLVIVTGFLLVAWVGDLQPQAALHWWLHLWDAWPVRVFFATGGSAWALGWAYWRAWKWFFGKLKPLGSIKSALEMIG